MREILRKADHIVTVSENSKHDIMTLFGVEERRITNTYQAVAIPEEVRAKSDAAVAEEVAGFGLEARNYLLFYGSIEPKKISAGWWNAISAPTSRCRWWWWRPSPGSATTRCG